MFRCRSRKRTATDRKNKVKKVLTQESTHDIISELRLRKTKHFRKAGNSKKQEGRNSTLTNKQ